MQTSMLPHTSTPSASQQRIILVVALALCLCFLSAATSVNATLGVDITQIPAIIESTVGMATWHG